MEIKKKFRIRNLVNTKKKKIITGCIALTVVIATIGGVYAFSNDDSDKLVLKEEYTKTIKIEYGDAINQELKTYLNTTDLDKEDKKDVLSLTKIAIKTKDNKKAVNETDKDYLSVGEYKLVLSYEDETAIVKVKIQDTTKPTIEGVDNIDIVQGTDLDTYDFKGMFTIKDLSKVDTKFDYSKIDPNTIGSYKLNITSTDVYKNKTSKEITVNITAKPVETKETESNTTNSTSYSSTNSSSNKTSSTTSTSKPSTNTNTSKPSTPSTPVAKKCHLFCRKCNKEFVGDDFNSAYALLFAHYKTHYPDSKVASYYESWY